MATLGCDGPKRRHGRSIVFWKSRRRREKFAMILAGGIGGKHHLTRHQERSWPEQHPWRIKHLSHLHLQQDQASHQFPFRNNNRCITDIGPSCPLAGVVASGEHRKVFGVKYNGLAWMLKSAIEVSFASSHGAGGWSLCPHISFRPTVDERTDPVFRILELLEVAAVALLHEGEQGICTRERVDFFTQCQMRVSQLFQAKKSTSLATNSQNQSMAHRLAKATYILRANQVSSYSSLALRALHTGTRTLIHAFRIRVA
ncbi:hypothetical protein PG985_000181 [Apiospora marii]|uniref:uncharacterized protein n=1 Tax=Apiospora marii TaxID=335849 RepID=UPI00312D77CD